MADRLRLKQNLKHTSESTYDKKRRFTKQNICCRDNLDAEDPSVIFIEPIYAENTYRNIKSALTACVQNEILVGQQLYGLRQ
jgi:hypothetical protein